MTLWTYPRLQNTGWMSYCRIDFPSSHPGDDLWQNKQPFGPSSLSNVNLSAETRGLNQRSDDIQPSVVVLSVLGHEVERKHTMTDVFLLFFFFHMKQIDKHKHRVCSWLPSCTKRRTRSHKSATTHTSYPLVPRAGRPEIAELRPFWFFHFIEQSRRIK